MESLISASGVIKKTLGTPLRNSPLLKSPSGGTLVILGSVLSLVGFALFAFSVLSSLFDFVYLLAPPSLSSGSTLHVPTTATVTGAPLSAALFVFGYD